MQRESDAMVAIREAEQWLERLSDEELAEIDRELAFELWLPLPGPQTAAFYSEADELFYGGAAGGGKGLLNQELVATPYGYRPIGDLRVGERVLSAAGTPSQVIGVYPQPEQPVYRVSFSDGGSLVTDGPHQWNYSVARKGRWAKSGLDWKVATTEQLLTMTEAGREILIPLCEPLRFTKSYRYNMREVDPYLLGVLLGDGCLRGDRVMFSKPDEHFRGLFPGDWTCDSDSRNGVLTHRARGETRRHLVAALTRIGVYGLLAHEKAVPESYLWGDIETRTALLQGLMDTDGYCSPDGKAYFSSASRTLANQVRWLAFSLGGRATVTEKEPFYRDASGERRQGRTAYTVYIRMPDNRVLFRLPRKHDLAGLYNGGKAPKRKIVAIIPEGRAATTCIRIDHPSSLYVAGEDLVVTHNTDLLIGVALTAQRRSMIFRKEAVQLRGIQDRMAQVLKSREGFSSQAGIWRLPALGRQVEFGGVKNPGDEEKYQGIPHDFKAFDEITHFTEKVYRFLNGWKRTEVVGQRVRTICTGNPPVDSDGEWVMRYWGPWLDPEYRGQKAKPGELRWFAVIDGEDVQCDGPAVIHHKGELIEPRSRTFIPSSVFDNPYYVQSGYVAQLQSLPEPLRSLMLHGDFQAAKTPNPWQVIPEAWVEAAMQRWQPRASKGRLVSMGADVARGGKAEFVIANRHEGWWFDELLAVPGSAVPDGPTAAGLIVGRRRDNAPVHVDVVGVGGSVVDALGQNDIHVVAINGADASHQHDRTGQLGFVNYRSWAWWHLRELLEPAADLGVALPRDPQLKADLCAPRWRLTERGIAVESKYKSATSQEPEIVKRLGRSPDRGDAVVLAAIETMPRALRSNTTGRQGQTSGRVRGWL